jgi:GDPmannose 4,6-dehydratase
MKVAFITGITGQDGSFLAEFLLKKDYNVYGLVRITSVNNMDRITNILNNNKLHLHYGDITDETSILNIFKEIIKSNCNMTVLEIYNLAAQSHVGISFSMPEYTALTDGIGPLKLLEAIRTLKLEKIARFYQASTSELYGKIQETPQTETTPFYPRSPYGVAKLYSFWIVKNYRESYNLFACNGILFNHESERRGEEFITRKITLGLKKILNGEQNILTVGSLDTKRDWGYAGEYIEGMWLMLQQDKPDDFVLATGETHTVREFIEASFKLKGFTLKWSGTGVDEIGYDEYTGKKLISIDPKYYRACEVDLLIGDASKAKQILRWQPKIKFNDLVKIMVDFDCK